MARKFVLAWIAVCIVGAGYITQARATGTQRQETYSSESNGFSVTAPAGWHRIPDSAIRQFCKTVFRDKKAQSAQFEIAFQARRPPWFVHPYIIVQVIDYGFWGEPGEHRMRQMVAQVTGLTEEELKAPVRREVAEALGNMGTIKTEFIPAEKKFIWELRADVANVGRVRGSCVGYFGRKKLVMVNCYCLERDLSRLGSTFRQFQDSFEFHPGFEYQKIEWYKKPIVVVGLIAAGVVVLSLVFRRR